MMAQSKKAVKKEIKDNKNLITIVLLIIAGIVVLSYTNSTGFVGKSLTCTGQTNIAVSPSEVTKGENIYIKINPGKNGCYDATSLEISKKIGGKRTVLQDLKVQYCGAKCNAYKEIKYKTSTSWKSGTYYVSVKQSNGALKEASFELV